MSTLNKILYAEDEPDIQTITKMALSDLGGFDLKTCNNGAEAVEHAEAFAPDLILLDVMMPTMDGPSALKLIKKIDSLKNTPVIFMTAKAQSHEVQQYLDLGAIDVIAKPFDPMTLASNITDIYNKHS